MPDLEGEESLTGSVRLWSTGVAVCVFPLFFLLWLQSVCRCLKRSLLHFQKSLDGSAGHAVKRQPRFWSSTLALMFRHVVARGSRRRRAETFLPALCGNVALESPAAESNITPKLLLGLHRRISERRDEGNGHQETQHGGILLSAGLQLQERSSTSSGSM